MRQADVLSDGWVLPPSSEEDAVGHCQPYADTDPCQAHPWPGTGVDVLLAGIGISVWLASPEKDRFQTGPEFSREGLSQPPFEDAYNDGPTSPVAVPKRRATTDTTEDAVGVARSAARHAGPHFVPPRPPTS